MTAKEVVMITIQEIEAKLKQMKIAWNLYVVVKVMGLEWQIWGNNHVNVDSLGTTLTVRANARRCMKQMLCTLIYY
jgi:TRAP-type mannitol/chloroaromatic compound transport system permease small subunit